MKPKLSPGTKVFLVTLLISVVLFFGGLWVFSKALSFLFGIHEQEATVDDHD